MWGMSSYFLRGLSRKPAEAIYLLTRVGTVLVVSVKAYLRLLHAEADPLFGEVPVLLIQHTLCLQTL